LLEALEAHRAEKGYLLTAFLFTDINLEETAAVEMVHPGLALGQQPLRS
jgi:hypothetical protein